MPQTPVCLSVSVDIRDKSIPAKGDDGKAARGKSRVNAIAQHQVPAFKPPATTVYLIPLFGQALDAPAAVTVKHNNFIPESWTLAPPTPDDGASIRCRSRLAMCRRKPNPDYCEGEKARHTPNETELSHRWRERA